MDNFKVIICDNFPVSQSKFIKAFQVFKSDRAIGNTDEWQTILMLKSDFSNELLNEKMNFYKSLGYTVKSLFQPFK